MTYELHPLCTLFPRLAGAEFDALRDDIKAHGLRAPIVLHQGMILDGGNRYRACIEAGVEPRFVAFEGDSIVAFVLSANLHRRHLSAGQQAAIVAAAQDWAKAHLPHREKGAVLHPSAGTTVAQRAAQSGASHRTQQLADKVAKVDPELARQVAHGTVSLPEAVERVTGKRPGKKPPKPAVAQPAASPHPAPTPKERVEAVAKAVQEAGEPDEETTTAEDAWGDTDLASLCEEQQAEIAALREQIAAAEADDLKAEAMKWRRARDAAERSMSEAMDRELGAKKREAEVMKWLRRCGKAVGEDVPHKIPVAVEKLARAGKGA